MTSNYRQRYGGVEMNDYFRAVLSSQQYKANVRHRNSARTQKGEKRGEKRGGGGEGERKKKERKKQCCCFSTNCYLSASPTQWKASQRCRGQDQELKAALLCIGAHCLTRGDPESALAGGAGHSWEAKAILGFFLPSLYCLPLRNFP